MKRNKALMIGAAAAAAAGVAGLAFWRIKKMKAEKHSASINHKSTPTAEYKSKIGV